MAIYALNYDQDNNITTIMRRTGGFSAGTVTFPFTLMTDDSVLLVGEFEGEDPRALFGIDSQVQDVFNRLNSSESFSYVSTTPRTISSVNDLKNLFTKSVQTVGNGPIFFPVTVEDWDRESQVTSGYGTSSESVIPYSYTHSTSQLRVYNDDGDQTEVVSGRRWTSTESNDGVTQGRNIINLWHTPQYSNVPNVAENRTGVNIGTSFDEGSNARNPGRSTVPHRGWITHIAERPVPLTEEPDGSYLTDWKMTGMLVEEDSISFNMGDVDRDGDNDYPTLYYENPGIYANAWNGPTRVFEVTPSGAQNMGAPVATLQVSSTAPTEERGFWFNPTNGHLHVWTE